MRRTKRDLYGDLGVPQGASTDAVKRAYRRKAVELHPDKNKSPLAIELWHRAQRAYETLGDEAARKAYDETGAEAGTEQSQEQRARDLAVQLVLERLDERDPVAAAVKFIEDNSAKLKRQRGETILKASKLRERAKKFKAKKGENLLAFAVLTMAGKADAHVIECDEKITLCVAAQEFLLNYDFEADKDSGLTATSFSSTAYRSSGPTIEDLMKQAGFM